MLAQSQAHGFTILRFPRIRGMFWILEGSDATEEWLSPSQCIKGTRRSNEGFSEGAEEGANTLSLAVHT
jgi:hypothetical protein